MPAELPHIFERFYRGSRANEARGSGSGLGLAIVRSIVDMHGGAVLVESQVGVGTRFIVDLPRGSAARGGDPGGRARRRRIRRGDRHPRRTGAAIVAVRAVGSADRQRAGNFTHRTPAGESKTCTVGGRP